MDRCRSLYPILLQIKSCCPCTVPGPQCPVWSDRAAAGRGRGHCSNCSNCSTGHGLQLLIVTRTSCGEARPRGYDGQEAGIRDAHGISREQLRKATSGPAAARPRQPALPRARHCGHWTFSAAFVQFGRVPGPGLLQAAGCMCAGLHRDCSTTAAAALCRPASWLASRALLSLHPLQHCSTHAAPSPRLRSGQNSDIFVTSAQWILCLGPRCRVCRRALQCAAQNKFCSNTAAAPVCICWPLCCCSRKTPQNNKEHCSKHGDSSLVSKTNISDYMKPITLNNWTQKVWKTNKSNLCWWRHPTPTVHKPLLFGAYSQVKTQKWLWNIYGTTPTPQRLISKPHNWLGFEPRMRWPDTLSEGAVSEWGIRENAGCAERDAVTLQ